MRFHDAETVAIAYLAARIPEHVGDEAAPDQTRFVKVMRVGGGKSNRRTDAATLVFECYDPRPTGAADLAEDVREQLGFMPRELRANPGVKAIKEVSGPARLDDPDRPELARYSLTASINLLNSRPAA